METDTSISPCGQLPQARYIPSLYRGTAGAAAGDVARESLGCVFRGATGVRAVFFFGEGAAGGGGASLVALSAPGGGATPTIVAEVLCCDVCESKRCAAELVRW